MSSDDEDYSGVNPAAHKKLLSEISEIVKFQHIKKPSRSEPALKNSEFHLIKTKPSTEDDDNDTKKKSSKKIVSVTQIAQTVQKNTKQKQIGKQLKNVFKDDNVLVKPLEKIHAEKIQRTIAYDNTKARLGRWDAVVTKNQNAAQLKFPLSVGKTNFRDGNDDEAPRFRYKTQIMKDLEEIRNECFPKKPQQKKISEPEEILTLEEMKERRKELARLKLKESHKIAKQRMQGKIKSKKYHKLKKREDLKKKMKEFEELKATNPELALKELEKIEKQRIQERTTLRHKNTGTWAKNLQVRAKYDENVKKDLEEQLKLGRELTQKNRQSDSSDSEDEEETVAVSNGAENPWLGDVPAGDPLDEVFSGYKKFWEEHNSNQKEMKKYKQEKKEISEEADEEDSEDSEADEESAQESENQSDEESPAVDDDEESSNDENPSKYINDLFDEAEEKINNKMESKLNELKPKLLKDNTSKSSKSKKKRRVNVHDANYLGFPKKAKLGDIDDALIEGDGEDNEFHQSPSSLLLKEIKQKKKEKEMLLKDSNSGDINPESFLSVKSKHLITAIPKLQDFDDVDDEYEASQLSKANKMSLAEAFENDDIVNDFEQEVEEEIKKNMKEEDTGLPGWGSWGGHGVKERKPKVEKKVPEAKKKDRIIINTAVNEKLQKHLISTVPFPFKSISDFEASMRLPIGRDFIPETAHRKLTLPSVVTKAGTIIEPMSEDVLVEQGRVKNKFVKAKVAKGKKKVKKFKK